jgi:hypothetical protein
MVKVHHARLHVPFWNTRFVASDDDYFLKKNISFKERRKGVFYAFASVSLLTPLERLSRVAEGFIPEGHPRSGREALFTGIARDGVTKSVYLEQLN